MAVGGGIDSIFDIEKDLPSFPLKLQYVHKQTMDVPKIVRDRLELLYSSAKNLLRSNVEASSLTSSSLSNIHSQCLRFLNYSIQERVSLPIFISGQFCKKCSILSVSGLTVSSRLKKLNKNKKMNKNKKIKNELVSICLYSDEVVERIEGIEKKKKENEQIIEPAPKPYKQEESKPNSSSAVSKQSSAQAQKQAAIKGKFSFNNKETLSVSASLSMKASTIGQNFSSAPKFSFNKKPTLPSTSAAPSLGGMAAGMKRKGAQDSPDFISLSAFSKKINPRK